MAIDETVKGYRFAGDIEVKNILLVGANGEFRDIGKIVLEVNVFQSLGEHYLQGEIVVNDAVSLLTTLSVIVAKVFKVVSMAVKLLFSL
jgi:formylmethanofuran dehydrogenase subunit C